MTVNNCSIGNIGSFTSETAKASKAAREATAIMKNSLSMFKTAAPAWANKLVDEKNPDSAINKMQRIRNLLAIQKTKAETKSVLVSTTAQLPVSENGELVVQLKEAMRAIMTSIMDGIRCYKLPLGKVMTSQPNSLEAAKLTIEELRGLVDHADELFALINEVHATLIELSSMMEALH
jgi:hypothetical protein